MSFGERLKELREEKKMNQTELGKILGVTGRQVSNYESDNQILRDEESFQKIFKLFNVSADYLFSLSKDRNYDNLMQDLNSYQKLSSQSKNELRNYLRYLLYKQQLEGNKNKL